MISRQELVPFRKNNMPITFDSKSVWPDWFIRYTSSMVIPNNTKAQKISLHELFMVPISYFHA
jgi:hypothetical protein